MLNAKRWLYIVPRITRHRRTPLLCPLGPHHRCRHLRSRRCLPSSRMNTPGHIGRIPFRFYIARPVACKRKAYLFAMRSHCDDGYSCDCRHHYHTNPRAPSAQYGAITKIFIADYFFRYHVCSFSFERRKGKKERAAVRSAHLHVSRIKLISSLPTK